MIDAGYLVDLVALDRSRSADDPEALAARLRRLFPGVAAVSVVQAQPGDAEAAEPAPDETATAAPEDGGMRPDEPGAFRLDPHGVATPAEQPEALRALVARKLRHDPYDMVFVNYARMTPEGIERSRALKVVDTHDVQSDRIDQEGVLPAWRRRLFRRSEARTLAVYDRVIAISDPDRRTFQRDFALGARVVTAPVALPAPRILRMSRAPCWDLLFVGTNSTANLRSVLWFLRDAWPPLAAQGASLRIQGRVGVYDELRAFLQRRPDLSARVALRGELPDLAETYATSRLVIAPMIEGTGMKVKVIEALGHGKAVLGTSRAFTGIAATDGVDAAIADGADAFAARAAALLADPAARARLAAGARQLFARDHDARTTAHALSAALSSPPPGSSPASEPP